MVAALSTHDRTMFCRRVGNSLHFSKVYVCDDVSPSVARVLVAVLLATSKHTIYPTPDGVSFGQPKSIPPSQGPSRLFLSRRKINVQQVQRCSSLFMNICLYLLVVQVAPMSPIIANHAIVPFTPIDLSATLLHLSTPGRLLDMQVSDIACVV
jgi:hypothetical protein